MISKCLFCFSLYIIGLHKTLCSFNHKLEKINLTANLEEEYISVNLGKLTPIQESALVQLRIWLSETHNGKVR